MLSPSYDHLSVNYRDVFRPLIALDHDSDPLSIIQMKVESAASSSTSGGFFSSIFSSYSLEASPNIGKLFRREIKDWIDKLDQYLEDNRYHPLELRTLQEAVKPIYLEGKTQILKEKFEELGIYSDKMSSCLDKLNKYLLRILRAPHVAKIAEADPMINTLFHSRYPMSSLRSIAGIRVGGALMAPVRTEPIDPSIVHREMMQRALQLQNRRRAKEVALYTPKWGERWQQNLIKGVIELEKEDEIKELGLQLNPIQILVIVNALLQNQTEEWKLVFLFANLKADTLIESLHSFDNNQLYLLNASLKRGIIHNRTWFEDATKKQVLSMQYGCKIIEDQVDAITSRYKDDERCHLLTERDIQLIYELADNIWLRLTGISDKLEKIYEQTIQDSDVLALLFSEIPERYRKLHTLLTDKSDSDDNTDNLLWPTLYEKVFHTSELEDDDEAMEIFGAWSIFTINDYWKSGLFGNISEDEFRGLTEKHQTTELFILAVGNLTYLNIKHISDWKRVEIFNASMLKNYVARECNARALKTRSLSADHS